MTAKLAGAKWKHSNGNTGDKVITLHADGSSSINWAPRKGSWKVTGATEVILDVKNTPGEEKVTVDLDANQMKWADGAVATRLSE